MTTNLKIEKTLKDRVTDFAGVFNYNDLDNIHPYRGKVLVVNYVTDQEAIDGKVGHYCVIDLRYGVIKGDYVSGFYFFDAYGLPPDIPRQILQLPNTNNITRYLNRCGAINSIKGNDRDFQSTKPWDNLCGVYAMLYTVNPNFNKNPVFSTSESRVRLDSDMEHIFNRLNVLGNSSEDYKSLEAFNQLRSMAGAK